MTRLLTVSTGTQIYSLLYWLVLALQHTTPHYLSNIICSDCQCYNHETKTYIHNSDGCHDNVTLASCPEPSCHSWYSLRPSFMSPFPPLGCVPYPIARGKFFWYQAISYYRIIFLPILYSCVGVVGRVSIVCSGLHNGSVVRVVVLFYFLHFLLSSHTLAYFYQLQRPSHVVQWYWRNMYLICAAPNGRFAHAELGDQSLKWTATFRRTVNRIRQRPYVFTVFTVTSRTVPVP